MLRSARVWQTAENPEWSALFSGRVPGSVACQEAVRRRDRIVHGRDDSGSATALGASGRLSCAAAAACVVPECSRSSVPLEIGFRDLVISTGSEPIRPRIPGLDGGSGLDE